jgi:hypothetical protein
MPGTGTFAANCLVARKLLKMAFALFSFITRDGTNTEIFPTKWQGRRRPTCICGADHDLKQRGSR